MNAAQALSQLYYLLSITVLNYFFNYSVIRLPIYRDIPTLFVLTVKLFMFKSLKFSRVEMQ